jgi:hypothetical protein
MTSNKKITAGHKNHLLIKKTSQTGKKGHIFNLNDLLRQEDLSLMII